MSQRRGPRGKTPRSLGPSVRENSGVRKENQDVGGKAFWLNLVGKGSKAEVPSAEGGLPVKPQSIPGSRASQGTQAPCRQSPHLAKGAPWQWCPQVPRDLQALKLLLSLVVFPVRVASASCLRPGRRPSSSLPPPAKVGLGSRGCGVKAAARTVPGGSRALAPAAASCGIRKEGRR